MGNYKQISLPSIDIGGYVQFLKLTDKIIRLKAPRTAGTETLHNSEDNENYIVPTGKKSRIVNIVNCDLVVAGDKLVYGTTLDSDTSATTLLEPKGNLADIIIVSPYVPAGNYITKANVSANDFMTLYIIEEDA